MVCVRYGTRKTKKENLNNPFSVLFEFYVNQLELFEERAKVEMYKKLQNFMLSIHSYSSSFLEVSELTGEFQGVFLFEWRMLHVSDVK